MTHVRMAVRVKKIPHMILEELETLRKHPTVHKSCFLNERY
jgi:hypothetical protein